MAKRNVTYRVKEYTGQNNETAIQNFMNNTADRDWKFQAWFHNGAKEYAIFVKVETDLL